MALIQPGRDAPPVADVDFSFGPTAVLFYKVTCPVCQMAAPKVRTFEEAYPGRIVGVGQDPEPALSSFSREYAMDIPSVADAPPYDTSNAYGIESVPSLLLVGTDGVVVDAVESWDRVGFNRVSAHLAELTGATYKPISEEGDGLPPFRPG